MISRYFQMSPVSLTGAIRALFIGFFCIVFAIVTTIVYLDRQSLLNTMSHNLFISKSGLLKKAVEDYINTPRQADAILSNILQHHVGDQAKVTDIYADLLHIMNDVYEGNNDLNLIQYGGADNSYIGISHKIKNNREEYLTLKDTSTNNILTSYAGLTDRSNITMKNSTYDMRTRPWFKAVYDTHHPHWTPIYRDVNASRELGIAYSIPAFNQQGKFIGVIASELHLQALNARLKHIKPYEKSLLLVIDEYDHIVASSESALSGNKHNEASMEGLIDNASPVVVSVGQRLLKAKPGEVIKITAEGKQYYASRFPVSDLSGKLKWQAVVIIPTSAIISAIKLHDNFMIIGLLLAFLLSGTLMHILLSRMTLPLRQIVLKTKGLEYGKWKKGGKKYQFQEIAELETGFDNLSKRLSESFEQLRKKIEYDPSSGMYTRAGLLNDKAVYQRHNLVALVHVTNMKSIMNTLGNKYADEFMAEFIKQAQGLLPTNIIVARDNIDKFIIVFPGINQESDCAKYQSIINSIFSLSNKTSTFEKGNFLFTGNAGMVLQDITPDSITDILMHAWIALRNAEKEGNAVTRLYTREMLDNELTNIHMHESLIGAIANNEFYLVLQPIVGKHDKLSCTAGECLVRWNSPQLGEISPDQFIPVAEESGLIIPLGRWIIEEACRELAAMIKRGAPANFRLHLNISAVQLLQPGFAWHLMDTIKLHGLLNENICIEIAENILLRDTEQACLVLNYLRRHNIHIALDYFGEGFSGLSYLHSVPFDSIKIARHLISNLLNDEKSVCMFNSVLTLAKGFKAPLIAEGIEDADMEARLFALGCDQMQGFHLASPAIFSSWFCEKDLFFYKGENIVNSAHADQSCPEVL